MVCLIVGFVDLALEFCVLLRNLHTFLFSVQIFCLLAICFLATSSLFSAVFWSLPTFFHPTSPFTNRLLFLQAVYGVVPALSQAAARVAGVPLAAEGPPAHPEHPPWRRGRCCCPDSGGGQAAHHWTLLLHATRNHQRGPRYCVHCWCVEGNTF